jgi:hypothetical protein
MMTSIYLTPASFERAAIRLVNPDSVDAFCQSAYSSEYCI